MKQLIDSGAAYNKFKELVGMQGGDVSQIDHPGLLPQSEYQFEYKASKSGYLHEVNALKIGLASVKLGAGRETKDSIIDHGAGIRLYKKVGDHVEEGETLARLYSNDKGNFDTAVDFLKDAYVINPNTLRKMPLILKTIL